MFGLFVLFEAVDVWGVSFGVVLWITRYWRGSEDFSLEKLLLFQIVVVVSSGGC